MKTETAVIATVAFLLMGVVAYDLQKRRTQAHNLTCQGKVYAVGTAMLKYEEHYGYLPPQCYTDPKSGFRHSWRVLLLEFIDHDLFSKYDFGKAWDDPHNLVLLRGANYFGCEPGSSFTNVIIVHGRTTIFSPEEAKRKTRWRSPSTILMLAQVREARICWLEPADIDIHTLSDENAQSITGFVVLDGTYQKVDKPLDASVIRRLAKPDDDLPFNINSIKP